jgi:hypothetical protein
MPANLHYLFPNITCTNHAGGTGFVDQMMSLSLECGVADAELDCNDDGFSGCPCAGNCSGEYAPIISDLLLTGGVPVFIYIGKWIRTHKKEEGGKE